MLELKNIVKDYVSGTNVTHALKGITVNFRSNEFVSILGASGCGKTTSLNIIGGLDRYTSGDLVINGVSTKDYSDRDWDTYRNHSIGFIFQSYNLISHQTILKNVELALTISGIHAKQRKKMALQALKKVGLSGMEKKKPNQLSGGQCQRVAIARALVNNPQILLADEPTGALDSTTSVQIMELLKEVAKDRLVIMVTHNPELAEKYSTRIIKMSDGLLLSDSNPYVVTENQKRFLRLQKKKKVNKKSSMSIFTATKLSFFNLLSKLKRTILVTIAGSIGIIGVSSVLAVSQGIKDYISSMQNDLLSSYPIQIAEQTLDYTSLFTAFTETTNKPKFEFDVKNPKIGVDSMVDYLMSTYEDITEVKTNVIDKKLMAFIDSIPDEYVGARKYNYGYDVTNNIFTDWEMESGKPSINYSLNGLIQSYVSEFNSMEDFGEYMRYINLFTDFMDEIPDDVDYILDQYDVIAGEKPAFDDDELIVVVDQNTTLTDILLAEMGMFDHEEFMDIVNKALEHRGSDDKYDFYSDESLKREFEFDELLNKKYTYFPQDIIFEKADESPDTEKDIANFLDFKSGSQYSLEFDKDDNMWKGTVISTTDILGKKVKFKDVELPVDLTAMLESIKDIEVDDLVNDPNIGPYIEQYFPDLVKLEQILSFLKNFEIDDTDSLRAIEMLDDDEEITYTVIGSTNMPLGMVVYNDKNNQENSYVYICVNVSGGGIFGVDSIPEGQFYYSAKQKDSWTGGVDLKVTTVLRLKESMKFGCLSRGVYYSKAFGEKFMNDSNNGKVTRGLEEMIKKNCNPDDPDKNRSYDAYMNYSYYNHDPELCETEYEKESGVLTDERTSMFRQGSSSALSELFASYLSSSALEDNSSRLRQLSGLKTELNTNTGEVEFNKIPASFNIYPKNFEHKDYITDYLNKWNTDDDIVLKIDGKDTTIKASDRSELSYEDTIELIVNVINTLIDAVTIALVAFTSLSLLVSCFMIAVITYISVVERIKEIGVIRSLGGRKRDVANLFVMETLLTGLFSGVFGVSVTLVIQIIANIIVKSIAKIAIAHLTLGTALIMVLISVILSVISGLIPSQSAAHKDPVVALRSGD